MVRAAAIAAVALALASCATTPTIAQQNDTFCQTKGAPSSQIYAMCRAMLAPLEAPARGGSSSVAGADGTPVYRASECVGAIVNGVCHGSIIPQTAVHPVCHGQMLNGQCTGPMF